MAHRDLRHLESLQHDSKRKSHDECTLQSSFSVISVLLSFDFALFCVPFILFLILVFALLSGVSSGMFSQMNN